MSGKILVVDDEERYASMLCDLLNGSGYDAEMHTDPQVALERIFSDYFDLVISDYKMPVMDGAELLAAIHERFPKLPVIIVSGLMNMPELIKVANIGVTMVLEKPFDTQEFLGHVASFVEHSADSVEEKEKDGISYIQEETVPSVVDKVEESWSFPQPTQEFSGSSKSAKEVLENLHQNWTIHRHFILNCEEGIERAYLLREITRWDNPEGADQALHISLCELMENSAVDQLMNSIRISQNKVVLVTVPEDQDGIAKSFSAWWSLFEKNQEIFNEVRFLYVADLGMRWNLKMIQNTSNAELLVLKKVLVLPALSSRIEDIPFYVQRFRKNLPLDEFNLKTEVIDFILQHPWRKGLNQLLSFLTLYFKELTMGERSEGVLPIGYELSEAPLKSYLSRKQGFYLKKEYDSQEELGAFFKRQGYDKLGADIQKPIQEQSLFYPDLADEGN